MAVSRILFDLQNLDLLLDEAKARVSDIDGQLDNREELELCEKALDRLRARMRDLDRNQLSLDYSNQSAAEKLAALETKLYSGSVTSPSELQGLSREQENIRKNLLDLDEEALENLMELEEAEQQVAAGETKLLAAEEAWAKNQQDIGVEKRELTGRIGRLEQERSQMTGGLSASALQVYEQVRVTRGGRVMASVERGLCRSCGVTQPTHFIQRARSGSEPVQCSSCGSILYAA